MVYYVPTSWKIMHWACRECLVRPMCDERCERTEYEHYLCESCDKVFCSYPCKPVEQTRLFKMINDVYGDMIQKECMKQLKEISLGGLLKRPL